MPLQQPVASSKQWKDKISHIAQVGGIETSVIDNGSGRGTRIAWINTGSGLRYKVVIDRSMDIADAFYNQYGLAWLSHTGVTPPQPYSDKGNEWLRFFTGGLLTTCGLTHVGGGETDEYGERGLHGRISNIPAEIESIIQPDPADGNLNMSITGIMREVKVMGVRLQLRRTISGRLGESYINIQDEVKNIGNSKTPHMLLYHCNLGWPLIDEGTRLLIDGNYFLLSEERDKLIFNDANDFRSCPAPLDSHRGAGEVAAYFDVPADDDGFCVCGAHNESAGLALTISYKKEQLPWLTNWQHWGPGEYVAGLEPGTHPPVGQAAARKKNELIMLSPGESRAYDVRINILTGNDQINNIFKNRKSRF